jgi:hypothetical protein
VSTAGAAQGRRVLVGTALAAVGLLWLLGAWVLMSGGEAWGYDYRAYAEAAERLAATGTPYQPETLDGPYRPGPYGLYMYAPPLALAVGLLGDIEPDTAVRLWFVLHGLALAGACALMPVERWIRLALFGAAALSYAVVHDLALGNVSVLLLLPLAAAWRWLDRPAGSVAQALAMAVRPMLGVLVVWQLLRRQWRAVAWTIGAGLALVALSLPFVGLHGYRDYLTVLANLEDVTGVAHNFDISSTAVALGFDASVAQLSLLVGYGLAIAAILLSLRRERELGFVVTASASVLLTPLLWDHYLSMLVLPAAYLAARGRSWGLLLPLLSWLPAPALPFVALAGAWLPFLAQRPDTTTPAPTP